MTQLVANAHVGETVPCRLVSVAPMMAWTDRHERFFLRLISQHVMLYTEMVPTGAIIHGDRERYLGHDPVEHPLALQLGGADPIELAECARIATDYGFDEINLNVGCPSGRVRAGRFGVSLMLDPSHVARCVGAMNAVTNIPITVKSRIGVDDHDSYSDLCNFVRAIADVGCNTLIVHARKAWLNGLSPKENREIPPLRHDVVYRLKRNFPSLEIIVNGGVNSLDQVAHHLNHVDGVMLGRVAYQNPYILAEIDHRFFSPQASVPMREEIIANLLPYIHSKVAEGVPLARITRHIFGLFYGQPRARAWRRFLSNNAKDPNVSVDMIEQAASCIFEPPK